jgi:electron-transferring-flavoprotein dehydrogenase
MTQETIHYDVVIVGAGPSGLSAAIKLKQLAQQHNHDIKVCILEKGAKVGSHILSGAVLDPRSLIELLPDTWQNAPLNSPALVDQFKFLTQKHAVRLPTPKPMANKGNYIISLGELCVFLAAEAEALGCEIYPGFAATELLFGNNGQVIGVATGDMGVDKHHTQTSQFQPGMKILAKQTLFAEGCRGQLSQELMQRYQLRENVQPQTYGIGIKELWRISPAQHQQGLVVHTVGWPLDSHTYGGSFMYHLSDNRLAIGFVVGLDYTNPWLNPFEEFQRFKTHPSIRPLLTGGERIAYGARALNEGGYQSTPKLTFPGGVLIGDAAGFLNVPKIKGIHLVMKSGILAAETVAESLLSSTAHQTELTAYSQKVKASWITKELYQARNIRPGFRYGLYLGLANAAFETYITRGHSPWTLTNHADNTTLSPANQCKPIEYPKPDGVITFDKLSSVYLTNTYHEENQPCHLTLRDKNIPISVNYKEYASPEARYCPAAVYEIVDKNGKPSLQINAQNCIHCKTCDIKDPRQNIVWKAPEGGGGPNYIDM